jgi:predicted CoA-binding protein
MNTRKNVDEFLARKTIAVVGVSRSPKKYANLAFRELRQKGYRLIPVNPKADTLEGERCYHRLGDIEPRPEAALIITPPSQTEGVVRDAVAAGIRRLWIQQGAESEAALRAAEQGGAAVVSGECVLMFAEPAAFYHRLHRWVWKLLGRLPQ